MTCLVFNSEFHKYVREQRSLPDPSFDRIWQRLKIPYLYGEKHVYYSLLLGKARAEEEDLDLGCCAKISRIFSCSLPRIHPETRVILDQYDRDFKRFGMVTKFKAGVRRAIRLGLGRGYIQVKQANLLGSEQFRGVVLDSTYWSELLHPNSLSKPLSSKIFQIWKDGGCLGIGTTFSYWGSISSSSERLEEAFPTRLSFFEWYRSRSLEIERDCQDSIRLGLVEGVSSDTNLSELRMTHLGKKDRSIYEAAIARKRGFSYLIRKEDSAIESAERLVNTGWCLFVISPDQKLYFGPKNRNVFHHSSFLSGGLVIFAGMMNLDCRGRIIALNSHSGHYNSTDQAWRAAFVVLEKNGFRRSEGVESTHLDRNGKSIYLWRLRDDS